MICKMTMAYVSLNNLYIVLYSELYQKITMSFGSAWMACQFL